MLSMSVCMYVFVLASVSVSMSVCVSVRLSVGGTVCTGGSSSAEACGSRRRRCAAAWLLWQAWQFCRCHWQKAVSTNWWSCAISDLFHEHSVFCLAYAFVYLGALTHSSVLSSYDIHRRSGLTRSAIQKIRQLHLEIMAFPEYQAEAVQRLHFANNAVRIRMLGSIKSRRQKDWCCGSVVPEEDPWYTLVPPCF